MGSIQIEYCTLIIPARKDDKIAAIVFRKAGLVPSYELYYEGTSVAAYSVR